MKKVFINVVILLLFISNLFYAQSSVVISDGASIDLGAGTDLSAGSVTGTITGSGTINGGPLPVELVSFTAQVHQAGTRTVVSLQWSTATEINNYGFEVQRSEDSDQKPEDMGQGFETIGFVKGAGSSNVNRNYKHEDKNILQGTYLYRLKQIDNDGAFTYSDAIAVSLMMPNEFELEQNFPNPFNPVTQIKFQLPNSGFVTLKVYDILGNEIVTLVNEIKEPGSYNILFHASSLSSGLYMYKLELNGQSLIKKMLVMK